MNCVKPTDIKLLPAYPLAEAARYLGARSSTLRSWFHGRHYKTAGNKRFASAVLSATQGQGKPISFLDLVEAHVLLAIRKGYGIPLQRFRTAMDHLREISGDLHFLAHRDFFHDRRDLFLKIDDKLVSLSERGQLVDREIIAEGLKQLIYGNDGYADQFFPRFGEERQQTIVLNPAINFGKPCLARLGVGADAVAARFLAGEKLADLARDYDATPEEIEETIRWHERLAA